MELHGYRRHKKAGMSPMANWSDLPQDLTISIAKRLVCMEDFVSFGAVCKSWRSAATKENYSAGLTHQVPFLILPQKEGTGANRESYNLTKDRRFELSGLEVKGRTLLSSLGWLMTVSEDAKVIKLLHPLNRTQIKLPGNHDQCRHIWSFALSSSPSLTSDFVVMVLYPSYWRTQLAFCRAKDNEWTSVDTRGNPNSINTYIDLTYYKEQFYVLNLHGGVYVCDIEDPKKAKTREVVPQIPWDIKRSLHLVESAGTLLVVERQPGLWFENVVNVFEVPFRTCDWSYSKVKNLGNRILFLNNLGSSFSIEASSYSRFKSNCIYYGCHFFDLDEAVVSDMCIFTADEQSNLRIDPPMVDINSRDFFRSCLWIQPSF